MGYQGLDVPLMEKPARRRKRRIFLWFFLAVQVIFLIWLITGVAGTSGSGADAHAQAVSYCSRSWQGLYNSYADCVTSYGNTLNAASDTGKGIGAGLIIALWVAVDVILGVTYGIYRLASRGNR
jgi:hypothetical protein